MVFSTAKMVRNPSVDFRCDCGCRIVHLEEFPEDDDGLVYLSVYEQPIQAGLWWRIKAAWRVLMTGRPYCDEVVLTKQRCGDLAKWLWTSSFPAEYMHGREVCKPARHEPTRAAG